MHLESIALALRQKSEKNLPENRKHVSKLHEIQPTINQYAIFYVVLKKCVIESKNMIIDI